MKHNTSWLWQSVTKGIRPSKGIRPGILPMVDGAHQSGTVLLQYDAKRNYDAGFPCPWRQDMVGCGTRDTDATHPIDDIQHIPPELRGMNQIA